MSLVTQITSVVQAIAADIKSLNTNKVTAVAGKGLSPLTKEYVSEETAVPSAGSTSYTHGLGTTPRVVHISLVCRIAELGYAVGEEASLSGGMLTYLTSGLNFGIQLASNTTTIRLKVASTGLGLINMTNGIASQITPANWRVVVRAYA